MTLKIYKISQKSKLYSYIRSALVVAENDIQARNTHPKGNRWLSLNQEWWFKDAGLTKMDTSWVPPRKVEVVELGTVTNPDLKAGDVLSVEYYD